MKYFWLFWLPLLFLPNMGFARETVFGTLKISDFIIGPYLVLVFFAGREKGRLQMDRLVPILLAFVYWALLATISISVRYHYGSSYQIIFGLLKLAKLSLYGVAGLLTIRALAEDERAQNWFLWSLLVGGCFMGFALLDSVWATRIGFSLGTQRITDDVLFVANDVSARLAILACFLARYWLGREGTTTWRTAAMLGMGLILLGLGLSTGRGGILAFLVGVLYMGGELLLRRGVSKSRLLLGILGLFLLASYAYLNVGNFRQEVDKTLFANPQYLAQYDIGVGGRIDDGGRLMIWRMDSVHIVNAPILGTGFFHRGGQSGIFGTGSHNFFLQMFLETGLVGGSLVLALFVLMWHQAGRTAAPKSIEAALRAALVAAVAAGMGGEYFYGGMTLLTLLLVYAPIGAQVRVSSDQPIDVPDLRSTRSMLRRLPLSGGSKPL